MSSALSEPVAARDDLAVFHRTLAELCRSEVPLPRALEILRAEIRRGPLRDAVEAMREDVENGMPLAEAYARHASRFPPLYAALVEAGTSAGDLPGALEEIARHAARQADVRHRLRRALAQPVVTGLFVLLVGLGAILFALPATWNYAEAVSHTSPLPGALTALGFVASLLLAAFVFTSLRSPLGGARGLRIPVLGALRLEAARAAFASTLSVLLRREVPLPAALELTAGTIESRPVRRLVDQMAERARGGAGLAESLGETLLEPSLLWLVESAEGSRSAATALDDVARLYRERLSRRLDGVTVLIRPLAELAIGVAVFAFAYAFLVPVFTYAQRIMGS